MTDDPAELFRHQSEVRQLLRWRDERGSEWAHAYLEKTEAKRDISKLRADLTEQWRLGNRGATGDWRQESTPTATDGPRIDTNQQEGG